VGARLGDVVVRFGELRGLSSLPIPALREQFRYEDVLTVLPVRDAVSGRETVLVATRTKLAILTTMPMLRGQWMTRWAPWEIVAVVDAPAAPDRAGAAAPGGIDALYRLVVRVGNQAFRAQLPGEMGRKALRDFVVAVRLSQPAQQARR
jgi:hypothetical protein